RALHPVKSNRVPEICAGDDVALLVEVESPCVAAAFGKELKLFRDRMIPPDALLKFDAANVRSDSAAVCAVEPTVWTPLQRVGEGVRVFHAEAGQQDFRVAIGNVVVIAVGIK